MAVAGSRFYFIILLVFIHYFISVVLAFKFIDKSHITNPSIEEKLQQLDGSYLESAELQKSVYRIYKRAASYPPKKVLSSFGKKTNAKSVSTELPEANLKDVQLGKKELIDNITQSPINSTVVSLSTPGTNVEGEKYNVSIDAQPNLQDVPVANVSSSTTASVTSAQTTLPPTTTTTTTTTTAIPEIMPSPPPNLNTTYDHHVYYNSSFYIEEEKAMAYWVNFDELPKDIVVVHPMLSASHRRAATVTLSFDFPFYGHPLRNITIATGGFVYMGDYMHSWLAATQYIAPLMANFDTSLSNESTVRYFDNGTAFVIEWDEVALQDEKTGGNFTFQTTLFDSGDIVFVYQVIPVAVTDIGDVAHPVKVGLSDAYVIDRMIYFIRRKTIYEYHRIDMRKERIGNHTAIFFTALTTCLSFKDCKSCMEADIGLDCIWCRSSMRCSDGLDRQRQDWLESRCDVEKSSVNCTALPDSGAAPVVQPLTDTPFKQYTLYPRTEIPDKNVETSSPISRSLKPGETKGGDDDGVASSARVGADDSASSIGIGSVVAILLILAIIMGSGMWIFYAYRNPHTSSGQLLIRYRPSQWRLRSGEARYTAASVHM